MTDDLYNKSPIYPRIGRVSEFNVTQMSILRQLFAAFRKALLTQICRSKISVFLFLSSLTADRAQKRFFTAAIVGICVWIIASFLALALQCDTSSAWQTFGRACHGSVRLTQ